MYVVILTSMHCMFAVCFVCSHLLTPDDQTRVRLQEIEGEPGSDYINACYVDVSELKPN